MTLPEPSADGVTAAALLVGFVLVAGVGAVGAGAQPASQLAVGGADIEPDSVLLRVDLRPDGTGAWRVEYRMRLDDENATAAFETVRRDIEANRSAYREEFAAPMRRTVASAANATGREMALSNVTVSATRRQLPRAFGVVTYTFEWTGFATVENSTIRAGDAVAGLFLDEGTTFLMSWPDGYEAASVAPQPEDQRGRSVVWVGPLTFGAGEPRLVVTREPPRTQPAGESGSAVGTETPDTATTGERTSVGGESPGFTSLLTGGVVLAAVLGATGWFYHRRMHDGGPLGDDEEPPTELLSNEERVLALVESNGGRMKQQEVAAELDWTAARTSQVVGKLREADDVEVFRLGRENVLVLPDEDI